MNAVKLLNQKCRAVEQLFGQYRQIGQGPGNAPGLVRISSERRPRSGSAGMDCYPEVFVSDVRLRIKKAIEELLSTQSVIADLFEMVPNDAHFAAPLKA